MMQTSDQVRKDQLTSMTNGLRCRCPGFQNMVRVDCRGVQGIRYCNFTCEDDAGAQTIYPVGDPSLCRCKLGTTLDPVATRAYELEGLPWGYSKCLSVENATGVQAPDKPKKIKESTASFWPVAVGLGALLWYTTKD